MKLTWIAGAAALGCSVALAQETSLLPAPTGVALLRQQAADLAPLAASPLAKEFLAAAGALPRIEPRQIHADPATREWLTEEQVGTLSEERRATLRTRDVTEDLYYQTRYGSPLMYVRAMDILAKHGVTSLAGKRIMDYGCGTLGHLRMLAACGAAAVGVDVDPFLSVLYSRPGDTGPVKPAAPGTPEGSVSLVVGSWPGKTAETVGGGFDVIVSKNTLKAGYIHPTREVDTRMLVDLGVPEGEFLEALHDALAPGGLVLIYNICPAEAGPDQQYLPHAEGRCPFPREQLDAAGLKVLELDTDDSAAARGMFEKVGYPTTKADGSPDIFAWYTVLRRE